VCILEINLGGHLETLNLAGRRMIGENDHSHVFGLSFVDIVIPAEREHVAEALDRARNGEDSQVEFRSIIANERRVFTASFIPLRGPDGEVRKIMGVMQDVTDAHNLADELSYQASYYALTGLTNRREFEMRLQRILETARITGTQNALCYLDLDQFKVINDTCGHIAGDELLRQLGALLQGGVRRRDTLARLGGDEFGVLMEHCSLDQAKRVANDLRKKVGNFRFVWAHKTFSIGVSIGIVPIDETSEGITPVMSAADSACYAAKNKGRNRIHVYTRSNSELAKRHGDLHWVARVEQALRDDGFDLSFQPIVPVTDRFEDGNHVELLLRMRDESGEPVPPGAFLPAAERYNLSVRIDRWVISKALEWLASHPSIMSRITTCAINISGQSMMDPEFLKFVSKSIEESHFSPHAICFEISETAAIANLTGAMRFMSSLRKVGCRFALDDFGSGLSSFAYLKSLPVDFLKIDGSFIKDIVDNPVDLAIVRSINEIGQVMEKHTIAEYVESEAVAAKLREVGIDYYQGYFIGRPRSINELH
jgi:diguanylate cyclase (GGDEF)-like protein